MIGVGYRGRVEARALELGIGTRYSRLDSARTVLDAKLGVAETPAFLQCGRFARIKVALKAGLEPGWGLPVELNQTLDGSFW